MVLKHVNLQIIFRKSLNVSYIHPLLKCQWITRRCSGIRPENNGFGINIGTFDYFYTSPLPNSTLRVLSLRSNSIWSITICLSEPVNCGLLAVFEYFYIDVLPTPKIEVLGVQSNRIRDVTIHISEPKNYKLDNNIDYFQPFLPRISSAAKGRVTSRFVPATPKTKNLTQILVVIDYFFLPPPFHSYSRGC